jgi:Carbohydrate binding domain/PEP-CTERM motif
MKPLRILLAICLIVFGTAVMAHAQLVTNGGFESGDFTGWTVTGDTTFSGVCDVSTCPGGYAPYEGNYAAYFGPVGDTITISQMITTTPGDTYSLSFYLANPVGGTPNYFSVSFGTASFSFTNFGAAFDWQQFVMTTVATGNQTELSFTFRNDPAYWYLDNVTVTQQGGGTVPEPGSLALFGSGVLAIGGLIRRKINL